MKSQNLSVLRVLEVLVVVEAGVDDRDADVVAGRWHVVGAEDLEQRVGRAGSRQ